MHLLFDIGGTNMRFAVSNDLRELNKKTILRTPQNYEEGLIQITKTVNKITNEKSPDSIAGGVAAVFDKKHEVILRAPHLQGWQGKNLKEDLGRKLGTENTYLRNDTDLAGLGEAVFGAGKDHRIVAYLTLSTGIGGSRIVDKKIDVFSLGFEPGHQIIDIDGSVCPECKAFEDDKGIGHWEALCSGTAIKKRFGKDAREIEDEHIWEHILELIVAGLNNITVHWSPDIIVLGGGLMNSEYLSDEVIYSRLKEVLHIFPDVPAINHVELGDFSAVYGAFHYLKEKI